MLNIIMLARFLSHRYHVRFHSNLEPTGFDLLVYPPVSSNMAKRKILSITSCYPQVSLDCLWGGLTCSGMDIRSGCRF